MLDESARERTEQPTATRREEARRAGQVPRSRDLAVSLSLLAAFAAVAAGGGRLLEEALYLVRAGLSTLSDPVLADGSLAGGALAGRAASACTALAIAVLPLAVFSCGAFAVASFLQTGFAVRPELVRLDPSRLGLRAGLRRVLGPRSAARAALTVLKVSAVGGTCAWILGGVIQRLVALSPVDGSALDASKAWVRELGLAGAKVSSVLVAVAVLDYLFERWQHERDLRMTREEVEEETLRLEGNRQLKDRLRKEGAAVYGKGTRKAGEGG